MGAERSATVSGQVSFLPVGEAAERLGVSRMRVREAVARGLLPARRDNRGHLRVDVDGAPGDLSQKMAGSPPPNVVDALFDEITELFDQLAERESEVARLKRLAVRQDEAMARAEGLIGGSGGPQLDRAVAALERAMAALEAERATNTRLTGVVERAMATAERMEAEIAARDAKILERDEALDRLLSLAENELSDKAETAATRERLGLWGRLTGRTKTRRPA